MSIMNIVNTMNIIKTIYAHNKTPSPPTLCCKYLKHSAKSSPHVMGISPQGPLPLVKIKIAGSCACSYPCSHGKLIGFEPKTYTYIYIHMHVNTNIQYAH